MLRSWLCLNDQSLAPAWGVSRRAVWSVVVSVAIRIFFLLGRCGRAGGASTPSQDTADESPPVGVRGPGYPLGVPRKKEFVGAAAPPPHPHQADVRKQMRESEFASSIL